MQAVVAGEGAGKDADLTVDLSDPSAFYRAARAKFDASDEFKDRARNRVTLLQSRTDPATMAICSTGTPAVGDWRRLPRWRT